MKEQMNGREKRIKYIDWLRAFGILLMIMGHIGFGGIFDKWIHGFHIPLFFLISGWFYRPGEAPGKVIVKKVKQLLLPYLAFGAVQLAVLIPFVTEYRNMRVIRYWLFDNTNSIPVASAGSLHISPIPGALWFLTALLLCELLYDLLDRILGLSWKLHAAVMILAVFGMTAGALLPFRLPWGMDASFAGMVFCHMARTCREKGLVKIFNLNLWQALLLGAAASASILLCPFVNMRTGTYGWYPAFICNALCASAAFWNICRIMEKACGGFRFPDLLSRRIEETGRNSIVYLAFNQTVILYINRLTDRAGLRGKAAAGIILVLSMAVLYMLEKLICSSRLKMLIGR